MRYLTFGLMSALILLSLSACGKTTTEDSNDVMTQSDQVTETTTTTNINNSDKSEI